MKLLAVIAALALALVLQTTVAQFLVRGTAAVDLVLIVVVYVALSYGPTTGLLSGAAAGMVQDALSTGGIIGMGGLAKTVVGYLTGLFGTLFIVAKPGARFVVFYLATVLHAVIFMGGFELLGLRDFGTPYSGVLSQALINALIGSIAFQVMEMLPGVMERRAADRTIRMRRRMR